MRVGHIHYTSDFRSAYRRLPKRIQDAVNRKDILFRKNTSHPSLDVHKLSGPLAGLLSFRINPAYRVLFKFIKDGAIFYDVDTHDIYK